jgi:sigma-E factor negative regulatory protein RseA
MNKDTLEHLSSLMDGELSQETGLFVARRMCADEELGGTWERYHLIRECLRRPGGRWSVTGLSLDLESVPADRQVDTRSARAWLKPLSGLAIAASVAWMAVLLAVPGSMPGPVTTGDPVQRFSSPNNFDSPPLTQLSQAASYGSGADTQRLNRYLIRHNQVAGSVGHQGFIALVPMVTTTPVQVLDAADQDAAEEAQGDSGDTGQANQP